MDQDETLTGHPEVKESITPVSTDMKIESKTENEIELHERVSLLNAFIHAISGTRNVSEMPASESHDIVEQMREIVFKTFDENEQKAGKTHLETLAEKQGKSLRELSQLGENRTPDDELGFLKVLVENIHEVQNNSGLGITPSMSLALNCMDCSMSTWTMVHEARKRNINIEFGSSIGHAVGIVELS